MWKDSQISSAQTRVGSAQRRTWPSLAGLPQQPDPARYPDADAPILVILDANVVDASELARGATETAVVAPLDAAQDGIEQIRQICDRHSSCGVFPFAEVHLVASGGPEGIGLGSSLLNLATLKRQAIAIKRWFPDPDPVINQTPTLVLYGYGGYGGSSGSGGYGGSAEGEAFLQALHLVTGAVVVACQTALGRSEQGSNWRFDRQVGGTEALLRSLRPAFTAATCRDYGHVLSC